MAEIVNLNRVKKARAKQEAALRTDENRARHGRTKAEKARDRLEEQRRNVLLDGARREKRPE